MRVSAYILTFENNIGLNSLLWSIFNQIKKPNDIIIINTGSPLLDEQLINTINYISTKIPITIRTIEQPTLNGKVHRGELQYYIYNTILPSMNVEYIWFLEDDLVLDIDCLYEQYKVETPNLPTYKELGKKTSFYEPEYSKQLKNTIENVKTKRGCEYGLLAHIDDIRGLGEELKKWYISADIWKMSVLNPTVVGKAKLIHTRQSKFRLENFGIIEDLLLGNLHGGINET